MNNYIVHVQHTLTEPRVGCKDVIQQEHQATEREFV